MINVPKLTEELQVAGIPIHGCNTKGVIHFKDEATPQHIAQAQAILNAHDPNALTIEEQEQVEDRTQLSDLMARRQAILDNLRTLETALQPEVNVTNLAQANIALNRLRLAVLELAGIDRRLVNVLSRLIRKALL